MFNRLFADDVDDANIDEIDEKFKGGNFAMSC